MESVTSHKFVSSHVNVYADNLKFTYEDHRGVEIECLEVAPLNHSECAIAIAKWLKGKFCDYHHSDRELSQRLADELKDSVLKYASDLGELAAQEVVCESE